VRAERLRRAAKGAEAVVSDLQIVEKKRHTAPPRSAGFGPRLVDLT
jgi:hypothetical protein